MGRRIAHLSEQSLPVPLFVSDGELAAMLGCGAAKARAAIRALEREGFPRADPLFGGRYLPAVRAFLDRRAGIAAQSSPLPLAIDGAEKWDGDDEE